MTVISGMKFNQHSGALVADAQSSTNMRKYAIATKIHTLENPDKSAIAVIGGTGAADILFDVATQLPNIIATNPEHIRDGRSIADIVARHMASVKRQLIGSHLYSKFGLSEADFQSGQVITPQGGRPIEPGIMQYYKEIIAGQAEFAQQFLGNGFLVMPYDKSGLQLYIADMHTLAAPILISRPFESIGIGRDTADSVLYTFFENMPREMLSEVNPIEGLAALISATKKASDRNNGVGGIPLIALVKSDKVTLPNERECKLGVELVEAIDGRFLPKSAGLALLDDLLYKSADFEQVSAQMLEHANHNRGALGLKLRGYKVDAPQPF